MQNPLNGVRDRYRGEYVLPPENDPSSMLVFLGPGHYRQPAAARALGAVGRFLRNNWKWLFTTAMAVIGYHVLK